MLRYLCYWGYVCSHCYLRRFICSILLRYRVEKFILIYFIEVMFVSIVIIYIFSNISWNIMFINFGKFVQYILTDTFDWFKINTKYRCTKISIEPYLLINKQFKFNEVRWSKIEIIWLRFALSNANLKYF